MKEPELKYLPVEKCHALKRNPQYMSEKQFNALIKSIKNDGFLSPILVRPEKNGMYEILAGNHRWLAAKEAGLKKVPAVICELDNKSAMRFAINSNTIHGTPNMELMAPFLAELPDDVLAEIHLEKFELEQIVEFDANLKERLDKFELPEAFNRASPKTNIAQCKCPICGKVHIAS